MNNRNHSVEAYKAAIKAAKSIHKWGWYAAKRYAQKRGVSAQLWRIVVHNEVLRASYALEG